MMEIILAGVVSLAITLAAGKLLIPALIRLKAGQSIKEVGPTWHKGKQGTPTMGGLMFIIGIGIAILILGWRGMLERNFTHLYVYVFALVFGVIGYILKLYKYNVVPIVLGLILGPIAEAGLSQALLLNGNSLSATLGTLFVRPICVVLMILMVISVCTPFIMEARKGKQSK